MQRLAGWLVIIAFGTATQVGAKLLGYLDSWTWPTVLWPLWLPPLAIASALLVCAVIVGIPLAFRWLDKRFPLGRDDNHLR